MNDIKNIKEWLVKVDKGNWIAQEDCSNCGGNGFKIFDGESGYERDECGCLIPESRTFNANAHIWMESLITTIESQQEKLDLLTEPPSEIIEFLTEGLAQKDALIESQKEEIESLREMFDKQVSGHKYTAKKLANQKAITELAVKGLEYVLTFPFLESTEDSRVIKRSCSDYLAKIERLTNAHIQPKSPS